MGPRKRRLRGRDIGGRHDRGAALGRRAALVHGRALARRVVRGAHRPRRQAGGGGRPRGRGRLPPPPRTSRHRPRLTADGFPGAVKPPPPHPSAAAGRLAAGRPPLDRAAQGSRGPRGRRAVGRAPELLGRGLRLPERPARPVRPRGLPARPDRRRGRRLLRDTGVLPAGRDRRGPPPGRRGLPPPPPLGGAPAPPADPREWLGTLTRGANGRRLAHEAGKVRRLGTEVVTIEPTPDDLRAMGRNLMSAKRRQQVIETAERTVLEQLRRPATRELLSGLPPGAPPSSWPPIARAAPPRGKRAA